MSVVDISGCYELLADDLERPRMGHGLPERVSLGQVETGHREDKRPYREVLTNNGGNGIAELFREETEWVGVQFVMDINEGTTEPIVQCRVAYV